LDLQGTMATASTRTAVEALLKPAAIMRRKCSKDNTGGERTLPLKQLPSGNAVVPNVRQPASNGVSGKSQQPQSGSAVRTSNQPISCNADDRHSRSLSSLRGRLRKRNESGANS
jgi:hypothetical protein